MPFSSGTFSRVHDWTSDRDAGIKISASRTDAEFDGIATGLTTCILKDGTQTLTAMIPFTLGLSVPTDKKIQLRDSAIFINSSGDGQLNMAADTSVTITTPSLIITDNTTDEPIVQIKNTHNGTTAGELRFVMDKGAAGADGDDLGTISFFGDDSGQNQTAFAKIVGEVSEADDTDEAGKLSFFVAESDGTNTALTAGLVLEGEHATDGEVDVTIGAGIASTTSVVGVLNVAGGAVFNEDSADVDFRVESNGEQNMLLVDAGNDAVIMGHSVKVDGINDNNEGVKGSGGHLQLHGATPCIDVFSYSTTHGTHGGINFMKSRSDTVGGTDTISTSDVIGSIQFGGYDSSDYASIAGKIDFQMGGSTVTTDQTAGEMVFYTTPNGSGGSGSTERMRITSAGQINGDFNDTSDERLKENISDISDNQIATVKKLRPVTFDWKEKGKGSDTGFIAQEVQKLLPNDVHSYGDDSTLAINLQGVVAVLTKALQEAVARIEALESK
tara:strand:+ start:3734 stop:5230 length:1497 start_codon:yes stop_codon:yes gene_type:complete